MKVFILTPDKELYSGPVNSVIVPGVVGQFEIRKGHAPIVSSLAKGEVRIKTDTGEQKSFQIARGFVEVLNDDVSVLVKEPKKED